MSQTNMSKKSAAEPQEWLTLKDASAFLGIHFTTLRSWADKGEIRVFRTPGGHRRFGLQDLRRFLDDRAQYAIFPNTEAFVDVAVERVRSEIAKISKDEGQWNYALDESAAAARKSRGRQLFSLAITYVLKPQRRVTLLAEGRKLGYEYGREAALSKISLVQTGKAVQFFRNQLVSAIRVEDSSATLDADDIRIHELIDRFLDEILYAVLDGYESTKHT